MEVRNGPIGEKLPQTITLGSGTNRDFVKLMEGNQVAEDPSQRLKAIRRKAEAQGNLSSEELDFVFEKAHRAGYNTEISYEVAEIITQLRDKTLLPRLLELFCATQDEWIMKATAEAMAAIGDKSVAEPIQHELWKWEKRFWIVRLLGELREGYHSLNHHFMDEGNELRVRIMAAESLAKVTGREDVSSLIRMMWKMENERQNCLTYGKTEQAGILENKIKDILAGLTF